MNKPRNLALSPSSGSRNFRIGRGKRCRVVRIKQLSPDLRLKGNFCEDEDELIIKLHALLGNRWCLIAGRLPGRTENEVKKHWDSFLKMKLINMGIDPNNHRLHHHNNILHRQKHQIYNNHEPSSSVSESCDQDMNSSRGTGTTTHSPDLNIGLNTMTKKVASLHDLSDSSSTAQETLLLFR